MLNGSLFYSYVMIILHLCLMFNYLIQCDYLFGNIIYIRLNTITSISSYTYIYYHINILKLHLIYSTDWVSRAAGPLVSQLLSHPRAGSHSPFNGQTCGPQVMRARLLWLLGMWGVVWCSVMWCSVMWCGVVWCGVVWCIWYKLEKYGFF